MTYDFLKAEAGRRPVWIIEIDLDYCELIYGTSPCLAAIGVTGPEKCYNTRKTCQYPTAYDKGTKTYRFSSEILPPSGEEQFQCIPCIDDVSFLPSRIEPGKGLGRRSVMTVTMLDHAMSDLGIDKYLSDRTYDSATTGTFFTKLMARNPYYQGRTVRIKTGYLLDGEDPDAANFITRRYQLEKIDGPDRSGKMTFTAKDPLKSLDDKRSQAPRASKGKLALALNNSDGVFDLAIAGIGDIEYATSGFIKIESEIMSFTRVADTLTVSRAQKNTVAVAHDIDSPVQQCLAYTAINLLTILQDLLVNFGGVDAGLIPTAEWAEEGDLWFIDVNLTALVSSPTGVQSLIGELSEQCQCFIWWDERAQEVKFKGVRPWAFDQIAAVDDDAHVISDSQSVKDRPDERVSQVQVFYGQKNPTEELARPWNFARLEVNTDQDSESADEYGEARIKVIYSRWLSTAQGSLAAGLAARMLSRYRDNPRTISFKLDAKDSTAWTADTILATIRMLTDFSGAPIPSYLQVIEARESVMGSEYEYILQDSGFTARYFLWADETVEEDYGSAAPALRSRYGWYANDDDELTNNDDGYLLA